LLDRGEHELALADLNAALHLTPDSAHVLAVRAETLFKGGRIADARRDIEQALKIDPNFAAALTTRGAIHEALGRKVEAVADFKRALEIDGTIEEAKKGLARLTTRDEPW
jgi:tetratricopeptide (TPR) repeat protein